MSKSPFLMLILFCSIQLYAQQKTIITYKESMKMDFQDFKADFDKATKEQQESLAKDSSSNDSLLQQFDSKKQALEQVLNSMMAEEGIDTLQVWREGNYVISSAAKDGHGKTKKVYELNSQRFSVVDSISFNNSKRLDTTATLWLTCDKEPGCTVTYKVEKGKGTRKILGFECVNYTIEENLNDGQESRVISVWVTNQIKPAISTYAVLRMYKKILGDFTPLEIKEFPEKGALSYGLQTAIQVSR